MLLEDDDITPYCEVPPSAATTTSTTLYYTHHANNMNNNVNNNNNTFFSGNNRRKPLGPSYTHEDLAFNSSGSRNSTPPSSSSCYHMHEGGAGGSSTTNSSEGSGSLSHQQQQQQQLNKSKSAHVISSSGLEVYSEVADAMNMHNQAVMDLKGGAANQQRYFTSSLVRAFPLFTRILLVLFPGSRIYHFHLGASTSSAAQTPHPRVVAASAGRTTPLCSTGETTPPPLVGSALEGRRPQATALRLRRAL